MEGRKIEHGDLRVGRQKGGSCRSRKMEGGYRNRKIEHGGIGVGRKMGVCRSRKVGGGGV